MCWMDVDMGEACSAHGVRRGVYRGDLRVRDNFDTPV
jgi:hypothetical protein